MSVSAVWHFAWIDVGTDEIPEGFDPEVHNVQDIELLGFTYSQQEAEFATLRLLTRNPISGLSNWALGLLGPDRKRWAWFSWSLNGAEPSPLALLRLVGIPTDVFKSTVTLDFSARPPDFNEQKAALNTAMRVLPYWDPAFIDEQRREDLDIILDTYAGIWYVDPVTHEVSLSDLLLGESGTEVFQIDEHVADGLQFTPGDPPLTSVTVDAEILWTQRAVGSVAVGLETQSYTLKSDDYPKVGASLGDGWKVLAANVGQLGDYSTRSETVNFAVVYKWWDGEVTNIHTSESHDSVAGGGIGLGAIVTGATYNVSYSDDEDHELTSYSVSQNWSTGLVPKYDVTAGYIVGYDAKRPFTEHVTFTLQADVQPLVTLPGEDETMRLDGFSTADLSELIDGVPPIGDPRRRSYITQARGEQSLQYLILLARAQLRKRSRAVEISFAPFLTRLEDLKLNRNAQVYDWRIPGGNAIGKIIAFSLTLTPPVDDGAADVSLECTIGCAIGNGGTVTAEGGEEEYVDDDYIDRDQDYQEYDNAVLTFDDMEGEFGYTPPLYNPNDDGLDFIASFAPVNDPAIFEVPISYTMLADEQKAAFDAVDPGWSGGSLSNAILLFTDEARRQALIEMRQKAVEAAMNELPTEISFKLKGMSKDFKTEVPVTMSTLKIPQMINLGAT